MIDIAYAQVLPQVGTEIAGKWDTLFWFLVWTSVFFFLVVMVPLVWFVIKYRKRENAPPVGNVTHNLKLEFFWTIVPTIVVLIMFAWGWIVYKRMSEAPESAYTINVIGKQWLWQFQYENGKTAIGELIVPEKQPVRLLMTSDDVLHDFFIPDFRIKNDVVPGQYTTIWFQAKEQGEHVVYCAEYCGTAHSKMLAKLKVVSVEEWNEFMKEDTGPASKPEDMSMAAWGQQLYNEKGCVACHSIDGSPLVGPTFKGLWGRNEEMDKPAGLKLVVDENYIRESIEYPSVKIVKGYQDVMPTYKGQFSEEGLNAIIAFIKSLNK